jgi:DNA polymerase-3 subunit epsilon
VRRLRSPFTKRASAAGATPWRTASWCAVDLELTGLDVRRDEIIAIGAVPIEDGRVILGRSIYTLVRTTRRSEHAAVLMHKLRVADLADAPALSDALSLLASALEGRIPVFHTAWVERGFLEPQLGRLQAAADTEALGRLWLGSRSAEEPVPAGLSLRRLASLLGLPAEPPHHALGDALTTAKAFIALATLLDAHEPQTVRTLIRAASAGGGARRLGPV